DLSKTTSLKNLFYYCKSLGSTGDMSNWDVSNITNMINMFAYAETFNQPIGNWNVSSVESFWGTFVQAQSFDQDISNWDVSSVTIMQGMFSGATSFNQPLGNWDVSNVTNMDSMFYYATSFNQPLANWDVSNVTKMNKMFWTATSFNQPLGNWDVSNVTDMSYMFSSVTLTVSNYNNLLEGWSQLSLQNDVVFDGGISQYTSSIERQYIIDNFNWIITDGGLYEEPSSEASSSSSNISNSDDVPIEGDNVFVNYSPFLFISLILIGSVIIRRKK
ncbi:MAG: BspA family leucine-rich repeat surface protein, partial [Candidatus Heimdallarchaeota archaeon]|nr:BspA family leucine-rich repeat surface protein [Candidatus Heimdallarchaeota archaeon]